MITPKSQLISRSNAGLKFISLYPDNDFSKRKYMYSYLIQNYENKPAYNANVVMTKPNLDWSKCFVKNREQIKGSN